MSSQPLWYGFADETFQPDPFSGSSLAFVAVVTRRPRLLQILIRRIYKKTGRRIGGMGELKAAFANERLITAVLNGLARIDVQIACVVLDKTVITRPPSDPELLYHTAAGRLLRLCVERWPRLEMHFDKRYTSKHQQREFERHLREAIADLANTVVTIEQDDSVALKELQAADFVAWAAGRKAGGDDRFWDLIRMKVVAEEEIRRATW